MVEASYVGNRGAWFSSGHLIDYNAITTQQLQRYNLDAADRTLLNTPINSSRIANSAGVPTAGFGRVNFINGAGSTPRSGQIVARFSF